MSTGPENRTTMHLTTCTACGETYDRRELDAVIFHGGDHSPETFATGIVGTLVAWTCRACSEVNDGTAAHCRGCGRAIGSPA